MNTNIRRLGVFFLVAFAIILGDVTYWQVLDASSISSRSDNPRLALQSSHVRRGEIFDRTGTVLARRTVDPQGYVHRAYTDPSLSQVIGYDDPRYGKSELESSFDDYLSGKVVGPNWRAQLDQWEHKPVYGDNLTLTVDDNLQQQVASFMPSAPSSAIVADPRTGEILAMVSKPSFDANAIDQPNYWTSILSPSAGFPLINRAVNGYYPPGSTYKTVTLSGALDAGTQQLTDVFSGTAATGPLTVGGHVFPDTINNLAECGQYPPVSLTVAFQCSDNIVFAQVGLRLGASRFLDYSHRFGLDQNVPFDIPVSVSHVRQPGGPFRDVDLAAASFGQGALHVTPMQMLMVDMAAANHGSIMRPFMVKDITTAGGSLVRRTTPAELYHPVTTQTADSVRDAMVQVVERGSGYAAQIAGVQVAGKTGTAEPGDGRAPHAWFICFAPADHPRVAVVVMVEHGGEGATVAAPIAKRILQAALSRVH